jgi:hypothetical protein
MRRLNYWMFKRLMYAAAYGMGPKRMVRDWPVRGRIYNLLWR